MGYRLVSAAYRTPVGNAATKSVLVALADAACNECGLAWPGVPLLEQKTELGSSTVRGALASLAKQGLIRVLRYPNGGRGVTTEYRVLEQVIELSTCPCGECASKMKNPPRAGGYDNHGTGKPSTPRRVSGNTLQLTPENPPAGGDQQSVTSNSQSVENSASPRLPSRQIPDTHPTTDAEWHQNAQEASRLASLFGPTPQPQSPATVNGDPLSAETEAHQGEAQD